jgi:hypothetical protein
MFCGAVAVSATGLKPKPFPTPASSAFSALISTQSFSATHDRRRSDFKGLRRPPLRLRIPRKPLACFGSRGPLHTGGFCFWWAHGRQCFEKEGVRLERW